MIESKHRHHHVLISFDVEEFDLPREHGGEISLKKGVEISGKGLVRILDMLKKCGVKATFFVTGNFAKTRPDLVLRILEDGHEVGCHGVDHFQPKETDIKESKEIIEKVIHGGAVGGEKTSETHDEKVMNMEHDGKAISDIDNVQIRGANSGQVQGYRQPRMFAINYDELKKCGYRYDSSVNPAWIPGRYNHRDVPRKMYKVGGVVEVPTSVATGVRVPLFWLALHLFPVKTYLWLARRSLKETGYLATYFHPWEFADELKDFKMVPFYIKKNSGMKMVQRLTRVILELKKQGCEFETYGEFVKK